MRNHNSYLKVNRALSSCSQRPEATEGSGVFMFGLAVISRHHSGIHRRQGPEYQILMFEQQYKTGLA